MLESLNHRLAALLGLLAAPVLGVAASKAAKPTLTGVALLAGGLVLLNRPLLAAYLNLSAGAMNHTHLNVGFALLGPGDLLNMTMVGIWLLHRLTRNGWRRPRYMGLLALYLILITVSTVLGVAPGHGLRRLTRDGISIIGLLALVDLLRTRQQLEVALWIVMGSGIAHAVMGLFVFPYQTRVVGFPDQANLVALYTSLGGLVAIGLLSKYSSNRKLRWFLLLALGLMCMAILLTVSRTAYIAFGLASGWWVLRNRRGLVNLALAGLTIAGALTVMDDQRAFIEKRMEMGDKSVRNRSSTYSNALAAMSSFPVFGVGYGQFIELEEAITLNSQRGRSAHSAYLGLPASAGIPAALCIFGFLGLQGRLIWRGRRAAQAKGDAEATWQLATLQSLFIYRMASFLTASFLQVHTYNTMALFAIGGLLALEVLDDDGTAGEPDGPPDGAAQQLAS